MVRFGTANHFADVMPLVSHQVVRRRTQRQTARPANGSKSSYQPRLNPDQ